jgi:hypothetical protein
MSNRDRVLGFLQSIAPADASNSEIVARTGITPHQQVFMITRELRQTGQIQGVQAGHEWRFWYGGVDRTNGPVLLRSGTRLPTATNSNETYDWDSAGSLDCRIGMTWVKLGRVLLDAGRLRFPKAPLHPDYTGFEYAAQLVRPSISGRRKIWHAGFYCMQIRGPRSRPTCA